MGFREDIVQGFIMGFKYKVPGMIGGQLYFRGFNFLIRFYYLK